MRDSGLGKQQAEQKIMFAPKPPTARRPDLGQRVRMTGDLDASGP